MDNRNPAVVVLFRGDPRREERQKRLPRRFLSTLHVAILKTIGEVAAVDVLNARDAGNDFRLGDSSWQLDSLGERIQAAIAHGFSHGYGAALTEALRADGFVVEGLPPVDDVDTRADAERLVRRRRASRAFLRLIVKLTSLLQRLVAIAELPQPNTNAALAFSSTSRGPPRPHRPR